jgi:hypothetical protein
MVLMLVLVFTHLHRGDTITAAITVDLLTAAIGVELKDECNLESIRTSLVIECCQYKGRLTSPWE